jgi:carnitine 3-dehydrogenase
MSDFTQTAVIGAGVIGASWTALFLAAGKDVRVFDPSETARADVEDYVARAWPTLYRRLLGLGPDGQGDAGWLEGPFELRPWPSVQPAAPDPAG